MSTFTYQNLNHYQRMVVDYLLQNDTIGEEVLEEWVTNDPLMPPPTTITMHVMVQDGMLIKHAENPVLGVFWGLTYPYHDYLVSVGVMTRPYLG